MKCPEPSKTYTFIKAITRDCEIIPPRTLVQGGLIIEEAYKRFVSKYKTPTVTRFWSAKVPFLELWIIFTADFHFRFDPSVPLLLPLHFRLPPRNSELSHERFCLAVHSLMRSWHVMQTLYSCPFLAFVLKSVRGCKYRSVAQTCCFPPLVACASWACLFSFTAAPRVAVLWIVGFARLGGWSCSDGAAS